MAALLAIALLPAVAGAGSPRERILATASAPAAHATIVDGAGNLHVAIERTDRRGIWYATDAGGSWEVERLTRRHDVEPAITVSQGMVIIVFARLDTDGVSRGLFTARQAASGWAVRRETGGIDQKPSIDAESGVVHLAFERDRYGGSLWYMTLGANPTQAAGLCCIGAPSIVVDDHGRPLIAFSQQNHGLILGRLKNDDEWLFEQVDDRVTRGPQLELGERPTIGYFRTGEGPTVRGWAWSGVNNVGQWYYEDLPGGSSPFDLVVRGSAVDSYTIGTPGTAAAGRIIKHTFGTDSLGTFVFDRPRNVRSVEIEPVGRDDGSFGLDAAIIYGRHDGVWTVH
ncbi:MAG: hypothetical protein H0V04_06040 [Chloroflexi bacterium]|nr:hypothetical protein [Chloroflexota bacterium]